MSNCCPSCVDEVYGSGVDPTTLVSGSRAVDYRDESDIPCSLASNSTVTYYGVWLLPTEADYTLYRCKWNYVKNLYNAGYAIDGSGDWDDPRSEDFASGPCYPVDTPNAAYWLDYNKYLEEFYTDLFDWTYYAQNRGAGATIFEKWVQHKFSMGTTMYGNLPQHKKHEHVGHCWMPCPYDVNTEVVRMRAMLDLDVGQFPIEGRNDHGVYYMKTDHSGPVWGFSCTYHNCPYLVAYGSTYFYA